MSIYMYTSWFTRQFGFGRSGLGVLLCLGCWEDLFALELRCHGSFGVGVGGL